MKLRFLWRGKIDRSAHGLLGVFGFHHDRIVQRWTLLISLRRALYFFIAGALLAYFGGGAGLYFWLNRSPHNQVRLPDLLLPTRWSGLSVKRGQAYIADGLDDLKAGKFGEAFMRLQVGVAKDPGDLPARTELAGMFASMNRPAQGLQILVQGLGHAQPDRAYTQALLAQAMTWEDYRTAVQVCDRLLARPGSAADRVWLQEQKCRALLAAKEPGEVVRLTQPPAELSSAILDECRVLALLDLKRPADATALLQTWTRRLPDDPEAVRLQARAFREAGRFAEMEGALAALVALRPAQPAPYLYGVVQRALAGDRRGAARALDNYLFRFSDQPAAILQAENAAAEIAEPALVKRCVDEARAHGFKLLDFLVLQTQARARAGDLAGAQAALVEAAPLVEPTDATGHFWLELMGRVLTTARTGTDGARIDLVNYCRTHRLTLSFYEFMIAVLRKAGRTPAAAAVAGVAQGVYPASPTLAAWSGELTAALAAAQPRPAALAPPSVRSAPLPPRPAGENLAALTDGEFFARLDGLIAQKQWAAADQLAGGIRQAQPDWLLANNGELLARQVRIYQARSETLAMQMAVRQYLDGSVDRTVRMLTLAQVAARGGDRANAIILLREVLRVTPDVPAAKRLLAEWAPPPAPAPPEDHKPPRAVPAPAAGTD